MILENRPWYERYQPISFKLVTRSGDEHEFADMVKRCNAVGVRIYVDMVINHMNAHQANGNIGSNGSTSDPNQLSYPAVPFDSTHFNYRCGIQHYGDVAHIRNCELLGMPDLNQGNEYVREKIASLMNTLIEHGVAGFRIDAAKHMWPIDLGEIYKRLKPLKPEHGFANGAKPFIFQEVIDLNRGVIRSEEYTPFVSCCIAVKYSS